MNVFIRRRDRFDRQVVFDDDSIQQSIKLLWISRADQETGIVGMNFHFHDGILTEHTRRHK